MKFNTPLINNRHHHSLVFDLIIRYNNGFLLFSTTNELDFSKITCLDDGDKTGVPYRTEQMDRMRDIASIAYSVNAVAFGPV